MFPEFGIPISQTTLKLSGQLVFILAGIVKASNDKEVVEELNKKRSKKIKCYAKIGGQYLRIPISGKLRIVKRAR